MSHLYTLSYTKKVTNKGNFLISSTNLNIVKVNYIISVIVIIVLVKVVNSTHFTRQLKKTKNFSC